MKRHWNRQLVSRERVVTALEEAELSPEGEWAANEESVRLTLASILTRAVDRQFKAHAPKIPARKYKSVAALSRRLQEVLLSLQDTDDPPELLPVDGRGRTQWEIWAQLSKGLEEPGADAGTDEIALLELAAFHQLLSGRRTQGFTGLIAKSQTAQPPPSGRG